MKALVYKGKNEVAVEEVPDPKIEGPTDAITKITTAAIWSISPPGSVSIARMA